MSTPRPDRILICLLVIGLGCSAGVSGPPSEGPGLGGGSGGDAMGGRQGPQSGGRGGAPGPDAEARDAEGKPEAGTTPDAELPDSRPTPDGGPAPHTTPTPDGGQAPDGGPAPDAPPPTGDELPPCVRTVEVMNAGALGPALQGARPGDCLVLADGTYAAPTVTAKGTVERPIVLRAANRGKAVFTSGTLLFTGAAHVVVAGFNFTGGGGARVVDSIGCRITRCTFRLAGGSFVVITGKSEGTRLDHSDLGPHTGVGHLVYPTGLSTRTRIDHNYLHDVMGGSNGRETISLGCCGATYDYHDTFNVVEHNLLVNCSGENEMIGLKSSSNTVRYNTILSSRGYISLRAGRKNVIHGNFILGADTAGSGGIRVFEDDHVIYNNYIETQDTPLILPNGDAPGGGHAAVERVKVVFNTLVVRGAPVQIGGTAHAVAPTASVFANNLIFGSGTVISERNPSGVTYEGNIAFSSTGSVGLTKPAGAFKVIDPMLKKTGEILRPGSGSPVVGAAAGSYPFVDEDLDGQPRAMPDVGADQVGAPARGPLTRAEVGPDAP